MIIIHYINTFRWEIRCIDASSYSKRWTGYHRNWVTTKKTMKYSYSKQNKTNKFINQQKSSFKNPISDLMIFISFFVAHTRLSKSNKNPRKNVWTFLERWFWQLSPFVVFDRWQKCSFFLFLFHFIRMRRDFVVGIKRSHNTLLRIKFTFSLKPNSIEKWRQC